MRNGHVYNIIVKQWQEGHWLELCQYLPEDLEPLNGRDELALMTAVANLQLDQKDRARALIDIAIEWGCGREKMAIYLIKGLHETLFRIGTIVKTGNITVRPDLAIKNQRFNELVNQVMIGFGDSKDLQKIIGSDGSSYKNERFYFKKLREIDLGEGWSANTVNTVVFRHHGIFTVDGIQYTAFYVDEKTLRIVRRKLKDDQIDVYDLAGNYNLKDAHNSISLGMDRSKIIHMSYDHHGSKLRYRRSLKPNDISGWTDELPMTGVNEERVTYPTFIEPKGNNPLLLLYRDGVWNSGKAYFKAYDEEQEKWSDFPTPFLSGADNKPWTSNAYWNHPVVDNEGRICVSYVWRTDYYSEEKRVNNVNVGFAQSFDQGNSWYTSNLQPYKLPVTQVNTETVFSVSPGSNLMNQCSMALDSSGNPHIVFYANDAAGVPQYHYLKFSDSKWNCEVISKRRDRFDLVGGGTLRIPISRPEIVIRDEGQGIVLYRESEKAGKLMAQIISNKSLLSSSQPAEPLVEDDIGYAEPIIDRMRWESDGVLSVLLQYNDQPQGDGAACRAHSTVKIVDFVVEKNT